MHRWRIWAAFGPQLFFLSCGKLHFTTRFCAESGCWCSYSLGFGLPGWFGGIFTKSFGIRFCALANLSLVSAFGSKRKRFEISVSDTFGYRAEAGRRANKAELIEISVRPSTASWKNFTRSRIFFLAIFK